MQVVILVFFFFFGFWFFSAFAFFLVVVVVGWLVGWSVRGEKRVCLHIPELLQKKKEKTFGFSLRARWRYLTGRKGKKTRFFFYPVGDFFSSRLVLELDSSCLPVLCVLHQLLYAARRARSPPNLLHPSTD